MAHSSFIDCDDNNILNDNFLTTVKVELENGVVNDDENVAVEALGQLGSYDIGVQPAYHIKQEDDYTIVGAVTIEECIVPDVNSFVEEIFERPHICDICEQQFKYDEMLVEHRKIHMPVEKPYECHLCSMSFHKKSSLKNHSRVHLTKNVIMTHRLVSDNLCEDVVGKDETKLVTDDIHPEEIPSFETLKVLNPCDVGEDEETKHFFPDNVVAFEEWAPIGPNSDTQPVLGTVEECVGTVEEVCDNSSTLQELIVAEPLPVEYGETSSTNKENDSLENNKFKPYSCPYCQRSFAREKALFNHVRIHNDNYDECLEKLVKKQQVKSVGEEEGGVVLKANQIKIEVCDGAGGERAKPHVCPICNRGFAREKALANHVRIHNDNYEPGLQCQTCHNEFKDVAALRRHAPLCERALMALQTADDEGACDIKYLDSDAAVKQEMSNNDPLPGGGSGGNHECHICKKRFKTRQKVFRHMWVHRQKLHCCEMCNLQFSTVQRLDEHRLKVHPSNAPFSCDKCGKSFTSKQGLTEHMRLHSGQSGQYFCADCDKRFSSRQGFTIHGRIHSGERPYHCGYCSKSFRDGGTLKKHERIHTGERPHECPLCHKCYNQKVVLREHIRAVHVVRLPMDNGGQCPVCRLDGMRRDELSEHIVRHSDELKWQRGLRDGHIPPLDIVKAAPCVQSPRRGGRKRKLSAKRSSAVASAKKATKSPREKAVAPKTAPLTPPPVEEESPVETNGVEEENTENDPELAAECLGERLFECEMCHMHFSDRNELVAHVLVHI
ncbi:zinc finger protein 271 [Nilaparvata lugens]|uniref:zinc finger protein 271 n=1 Tax=Nilaparvata lugens TaxID=108931 RepID=UPI00193DE1DD|nr:zinc finger protein 271 [Nilaparvata lugens]